MLTQDDGSPLQGFAAARATKADGIASHSGNGRVDEYMWDDGSTENALGLTAGGEPAWINHFQVTAGNETLVAISTTFGGGPTCNAGVNAGDTVRVYVWSDTDGDPTSGTSLIAETSAAIDGGSICTDVFQDIFFAAPVALGGVGSHFYIGASVVHAAGSFPMPMDESSAFQDQSWVNFNVVPFDPNDMTPSLNMGAIGFPANFLLRGTATYVPAFGACCDPNTGICTDNVELINCLAPLQFTANTLCADLVPACGVILGACCDLASGNCFPNKTQAECSAAFPSSAWFEGLDCSPNPCPPANDDCADAEAVGEITDQFFDTTDASPDGPGGCMTSNNIWYCYTATCDGAITVDLCGSSFDTKLAIYDGCACPPTNQLGCNDDSGPACSGLQSSLTVQVVAGNSYLIEVGGYSSNAGSGDITIDETCAGCCGSTVSTYPHSEGFESGFGDWTNAIIGDDRDWTRDSNGTPSSSTGPSSGQGGSTWYVFTESSGSGSNKNFLLNGPCFEATVGCREMYFWYHMYGSNMGTLSVEVSGDNCTTFNTEWSLSGDQGNQWFPGYVDLSGYSGSIAIRFRGLTGPSFRSDMALDNILVQECAPVSGACCATIDGTCLGNMEGPACAAIGNTTFHPLMDCANFDCPPAGACCLGGQCVDDQEEADCNAAGGTYAGDTTICSGNDCQPNGVDDTCDIATGTSPDCDDNGVPDECQTFVDCNNNGIPDFCEPDCDGNGIADECDIRDCGIIEDPANTCADPDHGCQDCNGDGIPDGCQLGQGPDETCLLTLYARNNGGSIGGAVYFDVTPAAALTVTGFFTNTSQTVPFDWTVYTRDGTAFGNESSPNGWSIVATGTGQGMGNDIPSPITLDDPFQLDGGTLVGMALVMGSQAAHSYTTGGSLPTNYSNADLALQLGTATNVPFSGSPFSPRLWNGEVCYELGGGAGADCNLNCIPDDCDIANCAAGDPDCDDCNANGVPDSCDIADGTSQDCQGDGIPDECQLGAGGGAAANIRIEIMTDDYPGETTWELEEQGVGVIASDGPLGSPGTLFTWDVAVTTTGCYDFTIFDAYGDGICCAYGAGWYEVFYEGTSVGTGGAFGASETIADIGDGCGGGGGSANDCNGNGVPDECEVPPICAACPDCNNNGIPDDCEEDCNGNGVPDDCDIAGGTSFDCNNNGIPDECENDCNGNGIEDSCDIADCPSVSPDCGDLCADPDAWCQDCNGDGIPDGCQIGGGADAVLTYHASARGLVAPSNQVFLFDDTGTMFGQYDQMGGCGTDAWGYRDGCTDGTYVYFGCGSGVFRHDLDGANGVQMWGGGGPNGTWRAMAYDPTGDGGNGSIWSASFSSDLVEADLTGATLTTFPNAGWSLYGLAYDASDGNLWGHDSGGLVIKIDTSSGTIIAGEGWPTAFANISSQGGLSGTHDGSGNVAAVSQGTPDELGVYDLSGAFVAGPWDLDAQTGETGNLGVAVSGGGGGGGGGADCNGNCRPDDCDIANGCSLDCQENGIPDECETAILDCNGNGVPDDCDIDYGTSQDCNENGIPDECDIASGASLDCQPNGIPDECEADCDGNGIPDDCDIANCGALAEHSCDDPNYWCQDCNGNGQPDICDLDTPPGSARNSGNCCEDNSPCTSGGCEDPVCEASVCSYDPYCCSTCWDSICAGEAATDPNCDCTTGGGGTITINLFTDNYPGETTWELVQQGGGVVASGGPYTATLTLHVIDVPVDEAECYDWTIFDSFGDGICCAYGLGWYEVLYNGSLVCSGGEFGSSDLCPDIGGGCGGGGGCDPDVISQMPNQSNGLFSDLDCGFCGSGIQVIAENFTLGAASDIVLARAWVGYYPGNTTSDPDAFTLNFRDNSGGAPGASIVQVGPGPAATKATTGIVLFGVDEYVVTFDLAVSLPAGTIWLEFYNDTVGNPDSMFWEVGNFDASGGVQGSAWSPTFPGAPWNLDGATDLAYELVKLCGPPPAPANDCNENCVPDECDIADGFSTDCNGNGVPDDCEPEEGILCGSLIIKGGACPAPVNRGSNGVTPITLVATDTFDATMVDTSTLQLVRADGSGGTATPHNGPPGPHTVFADVFHPYTGPGPCACLENLSSDGLVDAKMKFATEAMVLGLELDLLPSGAIVEVYLTGNLVGGAAFTSPVDCMRFVPQGGSPGDMTVESNVPGAWVDVTPFDDNLDGGGFASFTRTYPSTTVVTLVAEPAMGGSTFLGWEVNGVSQKTGIGDLTLQLVIEPSMTVTAVYELGMVPNAQKSRVQK